MFFFFSDEPYVAIIGDIKDSKHISNRDEVQKKLNEILNDINEKYAEDIASKFIITLGDEFQGLLLCGKNTMHIVSEIEQRMFPVRLRFGVGVGAISTNINKEMAIGADGPGYYKARAAIDYLKDSEKKNQTNAVDIRLEVDSVNQASTIMINTILSLMTAIKESWSERQREVIWQMLEYQESQARVAKRLGIQQPAVQKNLTKGKYYVYKAALDTVGKALEEIRHEHV